MPRRVKMMGTGRESAYQCPCCDWHREQGRRAAENREWRHDTITGDGIDPWKPSAHEVFDGPPMNEYRC